jgi:putative heme-binding domain-containing protein
VKLAKAAFPILFLTSLAGAAPTTAPSPHRVPAGYVIEQVAGEAQGVRFPMFATFDDRGRLFVTISSGGDLYAELQALKRSCHIRVLEDRDGDGTFEKSAVFAENLTMSMGVAWRDGKLYAADPPDLVTLEDTDGDGRADKRTVLLTGFGHQDNGSLHGLTFGPDGLLYMTLGQPDGYKLRRPDGTFLEGKSGALIRCRPDGSNPEVLSRGFENLVEVVFTARGEILGTCNWYQKPEGGIRDAIIHLANGGLYPYVPDVGTPLPVTGDPLPAVTKFPAVALSGLVLYRGEALREHGGATAELFSAQHNSRKVQRHVITQSGATFASADLDFVTSEHPDFHPSDVLEEADGSLLVIDTGGWYVQHCPTGKIRDSRAPGGIYRVRRKDKQPAPPARRPEDRTASYLAGAAEIGVLRRAAQGGDVDLAAASARGLGLKGEAGDVARLLGHADPSVRFAAAEALARCGTREQLPAVWHALALTRPEDRMLEHALINAAHHSAERADLDAALASEHPAVQKAALLLLDQPPRKGVPVEAVVQRLSSSDAGLRAAAAWVMRRHPEWAKEAAGQLRAWIADERLPDDREAVLADWVIGFAANAEVQRVVAAVSSPAMPDRRRAALLRGMAASGIHPLPAPWVAALRELISGQPASPSARLEALRTAAAVQVPELDAEIAKIAEDAGEPDDVRREAVRAVIARRPSLSPAAFDLLARQLAKETPAIDRLAAAETLARGKLTAPQLSQLLRATAGDALISPAVVLAAVARRAQENPPDADALSAYLADAVTRGWRPAEGEVDPLLRDLPADSARRVRQLLEEHRDTARARLDEYRPLLSGGRPDRGKAIFFGKTVACGACHRVGRDGGDVGPDLTKVGAIRSGGDLLESVLVPSSTFGQGYEPYSVTTKDGDVLVGTLERQDKPDSEQIVVRDSAGARHRLRRQDVKRLTRSPVSVMPEGLERGMTKEEFRDLLAYLQSLR